MLRYKSVIGVAIVGAALLGGGVTGVLAARGHGGFGGGGGGGSLIAYGTLTSLNGTSATVTAPGNTTVNVTLSANGSYSARSLTAATAGLQTGDQVAVHGSAVNGAATSSSLEYDTAAFAAASARYSGTVASSTDTSLTITTSSGSTVTVQLNASTRYGAGGTTAPTFTTGQQVQVTAAQYTDGSLVATSVRIPTPKATATATATTSP